MRTSLLQSAYSEDRTGPFANLQPGVGCAARVGPGGGPKLFDYPLPLADRLKSQLLISHCCLPIKNGRQWKGIRKSSQF
jgi:hypothetical protein